MKKYKEIIEEADKLLKENKEIHDKINLINGSWLIRKKVQKKDAKAIRELLRIIDENDLAIRILRNNSNIVVLKEIIPIIIEELNRYKNKKYDEEIKAKIEETILKRTGNVFYIDINNIGKITIKGADSPHYRVNCGLKFQDGKRLCILDADNCINEINIKDLICYDLDSENSGLGYVDDVIGLVKNIRKNYVEVVDKQREYRSAIKKFNHIAKGISRIELESNFELKY